MYLIFRFIILYFVRISSRGDSLDCGLDKLNGESIVVPASFLINIIRTYKVMKSRHKRMFPPEHSLIRLQTPGRVRWSQFQQWGAGWCRLRLISTRTAQHCHNKLPSCCPCEYTSLLHCHPAGTWRKIANCDEEARYTWSKHRCGSIHWPE